MDMDKEKAINKIFEAVIEEAPKISSEIVKRRSETNDRNSSGETQIQADIWANEKLKQKLVDLESVGEFCSEEEEEIISCGEGLSVAIDPLDGSSNIRSNNVVGTVVGIYEDSLPCKGEKLVSAFYILYGPAITAVKAEEGGKIEEYTVTEEGIEKLSEDIKLPEPSVYGIGGNKHWPEEIKDLNNLLSEDLKLRYGGAMVGDFNQVLNHGGLFVYPKRTDAPDGKLRILFECNPVAFIAKQAGGRSTDGERSVLEKEVESVHQRTPFFVGNDELIEMVEKEL